MRPYKMTGLSLLEIILVLAIATSLMLAGLSMYQSIQMENKYSILLRADVDFLFEAMKGYYQQQCDIAFSTDGTIYRKGDLTFNPGNAMPPTDFAPVTFDVTTANTYLPLMWPRGTSVVAAGTPANVYFAQFNPITGSNKNAYVCSSYTTGTPQCSNPEPIPGSNIVMWQSQIVVKMKDPSKTTYYLAKVGADCAVNTFTPGTVVDCSTGVALGASATYMVWQRMPSFASQDIRSSNWVSNPATKEFKLQYTHDPMYELYNTGATPSDVYTYYYCGG